MDIPTVSRWFGHTDGGALAMKTYGHLLREHSIAQRAECQFRAYTSTAGCGCDSVFSDGISAEQQRLFRLTGQRLRAPAHPYKWQASLRSGGWRCGSQVRIEADNFGRGRKACECRALYRARRRNSHRVFRTTD